MGPQGLGVEAAGRGEESGIQALGQEAGGFPAEDAAARRGQTRAQADAAAAVGIDHDAGPLQDLLPGRADLEQAAPAAARPARGPGQGSTQRPLQEVRGGATRLPAAASPGRQPQHLGGDVDAQPAGRGEGIPLHVLEAQGAGSQRVAAAAQVPVVPVGPAVDPDQVAGKGVVAHSGFRAQ